MGPKPTPLWLRFWRHVDMTGDCWIWLGRKDTHGYGDLSNNRKREGRAHRLAYEFCTGPIPKGLHVLHKCDTPACVNPEHLYVGTHQDNMRDMMQRKRQHQMKNTACPAGHVYNEVNTRIYRGWRYCRVCHRLNSRRIRREAAAQEGRTFYPRRRSSDEPGS